MAEVGVAFVSIVPSARGFGAKLNSQVGPAAGAAGKSGGKSYGGAFKGAVGSALKGFGAIFAGAGIAKFASNAITQAKNLEESINAVRVSYGKNAAEILKIGQNSAKGFGLSKSEFNGFAVQFQSFSKTVAGAGGDVPKTFESIIGRARDFASVMNLEVGQAAELFQSGLAGETEPLRKFGIDLSAAAVEAHAYSKGIASAGKPLTEQQKVQARYSLLMQKTSKVQGDFKNTSGGLANQQRILKAQFQNVSAAIGARVIPLLAKLFTWINNDLGPAFKRFGQIVGPPLAAGFKIVVAAVKGFIGVLKSIGSFVANNATTFKILGAVIAAVVLPLLIQMGVQWTIMAARAVLFNAQMAIMVARMAIISTATKLWAAAQWLLNAAMSANPIGLIIIGIIALIAAIVLIVKNWDKVKAATAAAWEWIKSKLGAAWGWIKGKMAALWGWAKSTTAAAWNWIKSKLAAAWDAIKAKVAAAGTAVVNFLKQRWENLKTNTRNLITGLVKFFKELPGKIVRALGNLGKLLLNAGKKIIQGLIDGIQAKFSALKSKLGSVTKLIPSWKGPLSKDKVLLRNTGQVIIEGLIRGMDSRQGAVRATLQGLTAGIAGTELGVAHRASLAGTGGGAGIPDMPIVDGSQVIGYLRDVATNRARIEIARNDRADAMAARYTR